VERAASLGGCTEIIERLSEKFETFLEYPVSNMFSRIPAGTLSLFGTKTNQSRGLSIGLREDINMSGGERQRLAL